MEPWQADVRERLKGGEAMEAMKALMMEMRSFSEKPCVLQLGIDTRRSSFLSDDFKLEGGKRCFKHLKTGCQL